MKKFIIVFFFLGWLTSVHSIMADELKDKTDSGFVGNGSIKPINSSFMGDISKSKVNDLFSGEDIHQQTDGSFIGTNEIVQDNSFLAGRDFDKQVKEQTDKAFAQDNTRTPENYGE